jgi:hypothetical protein
VLYHLSYILSPPVYLLKKYFLPQKA